MIFRSQAAKFRNAMEYADGKLLVRHNLSGEEQLFFLEARGLLVGSSKDCDLVLDGAEFEGQHARIMPLGDSFWMRTIRDESGTISDAAVGKDDGDFPVSEYSMVLGEYTIFRCYKEM